MAGPAMPPCPAMTSKGPTMGPVQENDTITSVKAMKKIPLKLPRPALESVLLVHEDGRVISKAPRNDKPNTTKMIKNTRFAIQLVERLLRALAPNTREISTPSMVKIRIIESEYHVALRIPSLRFLLLLVKKLTVIGIIAYTQGVITAAIPPPKAIKKSQSNDLFSPSCVEDAVDAVNG